MTLSTTDRINAQKAAAAVRQAVLAHTGRVRSVDSWKGVAAPVMGRQRLSGSLWLEVLHAGERDNLFVIDRLSYSYPVLVPVEDEPVELPPVGTVYDGRDQSVLVRRHEGDVTVFRLPGGVEKKVAPDKLDSFLRPFERREGPYRPQRRS